MSTSSTYSSNKLNQVIKNGTQHFIVKSYITTVFDYQRKKSEYHLYWHNKNAKVEVDDLYVNMSNKLMNPKEVKFFKSIINQYNVDIESEDGFIWSNKQIGFDKSLVKKKPTLFDNLQDFAILINPS